MTLYRFMTVFAGVLTAVSVVSVIVSLGHTQSGSQEEPVIEVKADTLLTKTRESAIIAELQFLRMHNVGRYGRYRLSQKRGRMYGDVALNDTLVIKQDNDGPPSLSASTLPAQRTGKKSSTIKHGW